MKTLCKLTAGNSGIIHSLSGEKNFLSRATAMGFTPGTSVSIVRNGSRGPLIVRLRDTDVAIGREEAARIEIAGGAL
jgi:ferrous iron transport protein A